MRSGYFKATFAFKDNKRRSGTVPLKQFYYSASRNLEVKASRQFTISNLPNISFRFRAALGETKLNEEIAAISCSPIDKVYTVTSVLSKKDRTKPLSTTLFIIG